MDPNLGLVVFDLDGTLYFGDRVASGALDLVGFLREAGQQVVFYTNSSFKHRRDICQKLNRMGFRVELEDVYTSGFAAALYLKEKNYQRAACIGSVGLQQELSEQGIEITAINGRPEALVLGLDFNFNYDVLTQILNGYKQYSFKIIACNLDPNFPEGDGYLKPGCGPIVAAVEAACETKADFVAGKPNPWMLEKLSRGRGYGADRVLIVGDSYGSDVQLAKNSNCEAILVSDSCEKGLERTNLCRNLFEVKEVVKDWLKEIKE